MLGVAYRAKTVPIPVYGLNALKSYINENAADETEGWAHVGRLFDNDLTPAPLLLKSMTPLDLGKMISNQSMKVWDNHLASALLGVCLQQHKAPVIAYSYWRAVDVLKLTQKSSNDVDQKLLAIDFLENKIIPAWLGQDTPYFIHVIN